MGWLLHQDYFGPAVHKNDMQYQTRQQRGFPKAESDLSSSGRSNSSSTSRTSILPTPGGLRDLLSYLGPRNPLPRQVSSRDTLWLFDNTAYRNARTGQWEAEFVTSVLAQHPSCTVVDVIEPIAKEIGLDDPQQEHPTIEQRILPFLQEIKPGTVVKVLEDGKYQLRLGPGGRNGISNDVRQVNGHSDGDLITSIAQVPKGTDGLLDMRTFFAEPDGWAIISDIDDTIKVTQTSDPMGILRSTFVDVPQPCPGMPALYNYLSDLLGPEAAFFYLSASPYNLYPFLHEFRQKYYPHGTMLLRDASWQSISGLLSNLTVHTQGYKVDRMKKIQSWLPKRKMIFIGDSTQTDPEAYGEIYRAFPGWVHLILIRKVTDIASIGIEDKNEPERFEKAFKDIPRDKWHVFEDPAECKSILQNLILSD